MLANLRRSHDNCSQKSDSVPHYKNQATVDLVPKGGNLPLCGDIYICVYDADVGSADVSSASHVSPC